MMFHSVQHTSKSSRLFWQLTKANPQFEVVKVDATTIHVVLKRSRPYRRNHRRPLVMTSFATPIERVDAKRKGRGTVFVIKLKEPTDFLYRFDAPFLYVDFEHARSAPTGG